MEFDKKTHYQGQLEETNKGTKKLYIIPRGSSKEPLINLEGLMSYSKTASLVRS